MISQLRCKQIVITRTKCTTADSIEVYAIEDWATLKNRLKISKKQSKLKERRHQPITTSVFLILKMKNSKMHWSIIRKPFNKIQRVQSIITIEVWHITTSTSWKMLKLISTLPILKIPRTPLYYSIVVMFISIGPENNDLLTLMQIIIKPWNLHPIMLSFCIHRDLHIKAKLRYTLVNTANKI